MTTFAAHGEYMLRQCGRVARVDAWGPWNFERTLEYARQLRRCIEAMPRPFGLLMVSNVQPILSPQAAAVLQQNIQERVSLGCGAQPTVLLDVSTAWVATAQYLRLYSNAGLRHAIFTAVIPAVHWLVDGGFTDAEDLQYTDEPLRPSTAAIVKRA
jgi:hypothetical protein